MTWSPPPPAQPAPGWWVELSFNRWVAGVAAEMRAGEQDKRQRQLRRRVERVDEALCLAAGARDARRALRRQGFPMSPMSGQPASGLSSTRRAAEQAQRRIPVPASCRSGDGGDLNGDHQLP